MNEEYLPSPLINFGERQDTLRRKGRVDRIELENLSDVIRGDGEPLLGRDDAVAQARVLGALHNSAIRGAPVVL